MDECRQRVAVVVRSCQHVATRLDTSASREAEATSRTDANLALTREP